MPLLQAAPSPWRPLSRPASLRTALLTGWPWPWRLDAGTQEDLHGPLSNSDLRIAALIPMGSITIPNKNGDFISIVSSEEKVTSTPRR